MKKQRVESPSPEVSQPIRDFIKGKEPWGTLLEP
jgi:hypothetical protein